MVELKGLIQTLLFLSIFGFSYVNASADVPNAFDAKYWRCYLKRNYQCPDNNIKFYLYTKSSGTQRKRIDLRSNIALQTAGWNPNHYNVFIIHGFNGTLTSRAFKRLRNSFIDRGDHNVFMIDWSQLTRFPCYLSSLSNMKLVSQCTAQLYSRLMEMGALAKKTTCIGHSLGAHICGMISNHLDVKQYKIVGLDPARPLIDRFANSYFKVGREDAHQVLIIHTNAGLLGATGYIGHVDFCINNGMMQPGCRGHMIRRSRCSHFQSVCFYTQAIQNNITFRAIPCSLDCPKKSGTINSLIKGKPLIMGVDIPMTTRGQYCLTLNHEDDCAFN